MLPKTTIGLMPLSCWRRSVCLDEEFHLNFEEFLNSNQNQSVDAPIFQGARKPEKFLSTVTIWRIIKAAARKAGANEKASPHWTRHSHATFALQNGADSMVIKETLGNASVSTTQKYIRVGSAASSSHLIDV